MDLTPRADEVYKAGVERVSQTTFLVVAWVFTAVSLIFLSARLGIRLKAFRKLHWDDLLATFAWILLLAYTITWQIKIPLMYWQFDVLSGKVAYTQEFLDRYATFLPFVVVWNYLFYTCLWAIKFSFLIFFRGLDTKVKTHRVWWWVVFALTVCGWIACVADIDYRCSLNGIMYIVTECTRADHIQFQNRTLYANMAADIVTDMLILSIPILILWKVQIPLRKKLILFGVFSATLVIIAVAIIRTVLVKPDPSVKQNASIDWLYMWSLIEMGVAIMIACVASFRQLFISQGNQHLYGSSSKAPSSWSGRGLLDYLRSVTGRSRSSRSRGTSEHSDWDQEKQSSFHSKQSGSETQLYSVSVQGPVSAGLH